MPETGTPVCSPQLSAASGSPPVPTGLPFSLGEGAQCGSLWVLRRPRHRGGWEEKVAAVAQSARVSATRDGLPVGQSQLRAPEQALGERTNKCSRARLLSLGVNYRRRLRPSALSPPPPFLARRSARSPPAQGLQPWGHQPRLLANFSALGSRSSTQGPPSLSRFCRFQIEPLPGVGESSPPARGPPSLSSLFGEGLSTLGGVPEGHQRHARLSSSPSPGYNFQEKLPPG